MVAESITFAHKKILSAGDLQKAIPADVIQQRLALDQLSGSQPSVVFVPTSCTNATGLAEVLCVIHSSMPHVA